MDSFIFNLTIYVIDEEVSLQSARWMMLPTPAAVSTN